MFMDICCLCCPATPAALLPLLPCCLCGPAASAALLLCYPYCYSALMSHEMIFRVWQLSPEGVVLLPTEQHY